MLFHDTPLVGAKLIELEKRGDDRGFFARLFCEKEFADAGLISKFVQMNDSFGAKAGVLRGMHYQLPPHGEVKVVRCLRGAVWDCILDIRPGSATFGQHFGVELNEDNRSMLYVPRGFAHSIMTLVPDTEVLYLASCAYAPEHERGIRWNDPRFAIEWPMTPTEISPKDAAWPDFDPAFHQIEPLREFV